MMIIINSETHKFDDTSLNVDNDTIYIVPFLNEPSFSITTILEHELNCPYGILFCFEGYKGIKYSKELTSYLLENTASSNGTTLVAAINDNCSNYSNIELLVLMFD